MPPRLRYCFLTASPSFLHPHPSLIINCLKLPFETQWKVKETERSLFPVNKKQGTQKGFVPGSPTESFSVSRPEEVLTARIQKDDDECYLWPQMRPATVVDSVPLTFLNFNQGFSFGIKWRKPLHLSLLLVLVRNLSTLLSGSFLIEIAMLVHLSSKPCKWKPERAHMDHVRPNKFPPYPKE